MTKDANSLRILDFAAEIKNQSFSRLKSASAYIISYVLEGEGRLHTKNNSYKLFAGDVFFSFPAVPYAIESVRNFKYSCISFVGARADIIMDELAINEDRCVFKDMDEVGKVWISLGNDNKAVCALRSESVLLYTFSCIQSATSKNENETKQMNIPDLIKKVIDENIANPTLTLDKISQEISYDKKYISTIFKKTYQVTISEYITNARIREACVLMEGGHKNVSDISFLCGYKDPLYFSRVFKSRLGLSPRAYIAEKYANSHLKNSGGNI